MSAESLLSIVSPAPAPGSASKAVDAHGDSGFDRMLGQAMKSDPEQVRATGKNDTSLTRTGAGSPPSSSGAMAATALTTPAMDDTPPAVEATVVAIAVEKASETTSSATAKTSEEALPLLVDVDVKTADDAQVLPATPTDKGADVPQVLPGSPPVTVAPQVETPAERPQTADKGTAGPQVLPGPVDTAPAPEPVASAKGTDVAQVLPGVSAKSEGPQVLPGPSAKTDGPQVLPGLSAKTDGPQILPGTVPVPPSGKTADRQILPGTETASTAGTAAEPATPAVTAAGAKATAAAMAALAPAVTPPPVRPLTDRTGTVSNSVRATGDRPSNSSPTSAVTATGTATVAAAPSVSGTSTVSEVASLSDRPPASAIAAPVIPVANAPDVTVKSPVDQPPVEAPPAPVTQAGTASQTYSLSNLSNAAVEATAQLAAQIIRRLDARSTRFEMALTPDKLGRVDVSLDIDEHGRLAARLAFDNPAAALDMKGRVDELRRQLEEAGFHLADDAFQFAERDRSSGEAFDRRQGRAFAAASRLSDETDAAAPVTAPRWMSLSLTPDRVDMKV
ncbi:flagellar hook-length control protein FliK [uncultured Brevundimonas sp.]|uniref:flagellar hook-length control protein FliK n=1 Tax=uncultured Brevundimonas sp. TaxID=213418 RepID=UPI0030ECBFA3|tara:strand:+ start:478 stop:2163 length:1686 start_codon:yes stop_codon:yes gene_type:complete